MRDTTKFGIKLSGESLRSQFGQNNRNNQKKWKNCHPLTGWLVKWVISCCRFEKCSQGMTTRIYCTPALIGALLKPQRRRQTADGSLQQTQAVRYFHRNLPPSAICNLPSISRWKQSKNDQWVAGRSILVSSP